MIAFRFELLPLDDVSAWGGDDRPTLHWFGLTEGWYWIEVGGHELLRYSTIDSPHPYVDYYVVRLWEDILDLLPAVLEPVPAELQPFIGSDAAQWAVDPDDTGDDSATPAHEEAPEDPADMAAAWYGSHDLDLGYLRAAPRLRFWRVVDGDRDDVTVDWQHDPGGEVVFTAGRSLRICVPTAEFVEAVLAFDRDLISAMGRRVDLLERHGGRAGVHVDLPGLRHEHQERAHRIRTPQPEAPTPDWEVVRQGVQQLLKGTR